MRTIMLTSTRTSGCKRVLSTGFSHDVECHWVFTMHQVPDAEVGSRHVIRNHWVAVDSQIGEGSRKHTAGFFFRPVKLVARRARNQRVGFTALMKVTEHLGPHVDRFLVWIAEQPVNGWQCSGRLFAPGAIEHMCDASSQQGASGLLPMCLKTAAIRVNDQVG